MFKKIIDSKGNKYQITNLTISDALALLDFYKKATLESESKLSASYEMVSKFSVKDEEEFISKVGNKLNVVLNEEGKIIASSDLRYPFENKEDVASFGIVVLNEYQGLGIGSQLIKYLLVEAKRLNMNKVIIEALETNLGAVKLYTRLGFSPIGISKQVVKNNALVNLVSFEINL